MTASVAAYARCRCAIASDVVRTTSGAGAIPRLTAPRGAGGERFRATAEEVDAVGLKPVVVPVRCRVPIHDHEAGKAGSCDAQGVVHGGVLAVARDDVERQPEDVRHADIAQRLQRFVQARSELVARSL